MKSNTLQKNTGYTIIETMIAVSLFLVVAVTGMGAFLNANVLHQKSQDVRSIMDNMSFIMEDMSRGLRTGYEFRCRESAESFSTGTPESCASGWAVVFKPEDYNTTLQQWAYKIESNAQSNNLMAVWKSTDSGVTWVQLNPSEVIIDSVSGFSVLGAPSYSSGDRQQPFVTIRLVGKIVLKNGETPFNLQTSVSQRLIDVN